VVSSALAKPLRSCGCHHRDVDLAAAQRRDLLAPDRLYHRASSPGHPGAGGEIAGYHAGIAAAAGAGLIGAIATAYILRNGVTSGR
jgi:hypothetical protein